MKESKSSTKTSGIGFCGTLTVAFVILKLIGKIAWPWVWVLAPMWIPMALAITILIICAIIAEIANH